MDDPLSRIYHRLVQPDGLPIFMLVMDGLGGYRDSERPSELEAANHPNLDTLVAKGCAGLHDPVAPGITPGSGPGHLGLFGYDPLAYEIGRGALSAAGLGFDLQPTDLAAPLNVCTLAADGTISDRRAGRLPTEQTAVICKELSQHVHLSGVELFFLPEKDHRALLVLRGDDLSDAIVDTDPQRTGVKPLEPRPLPEAAEDHAAQRTAALLRHLLDKAREVLRGRSQGNFILMRGFSRRPALPRFADRYRLRALALAQYPMYLGLGRLVGMEDKGLSPTLDEQLAVVERHAREYDFVYFHFKATDAAGEDGDFQRKCAAIEMVDAEVIPRIERSWTGVIVVTGDHSTPTQMASHSWHPVPVLLSGGTAPVDDVTRFDEASAATGWLGRRRAVEIFPIALAAAGRLSKYGA